VVDAESTRYFCSKVKMEKTSKVKKVLIAHQSTIPHYRVCFYNALEKRRPPEWTFDVVFDPSEINHPIFYHEPLDPAQIHFSIAPVHTFHFSISNKIICYQTFLRKAMAYDLIIAENAVNNLAYPLSQLHQFFGKRFALWGHGKDRITKKNRLIFLLKETIKLKLVSWADGFFAYTPQNKTDLVNKGIPANNIFILNNTIDIEEQRNVYENTRIKRDSIRRAAGLEDSKILLLVGRLNRHKRVDLLLESFFILRQMDPNYHLILVGGDGDTYLNECKDKANISYLGPITDINELAAIYTMSDVFVLPGDVGLGPLQAFCYDLPTITINSTSHGPEFEYLTHLNSIVLPSDTTPETYAIAINELFNTEGKLAFLRESVWSSINHLTIDHMADNFISGVNQILFSKIRRK
jgi:glycosyltransferase involved in cell wall biosynthesis